MVPPELRRASPEVATPSEVHSPTTLTELAHSGSVVGSQIKSVVAVPKLSSCTSTGVVSEPRALVIFTVPVPTVPSPFVATTRTLTGVASVTFLGVSVSSSTGSPIGGP